MTLPFRRRHHDDEGTHDRARALTSRQMLEPLDDASASWLTRHLADCHECRKDRDAYLADRDLLRSLRDRAPQPPRDLWARTSAALDRESQARQRRGLGAPGSTRRGGWRRLPFGPAAGALLVLVVVGVSIYPSGLPPKATPGASAAAGGPTSEPEPTNMAVAAGRVGWVRPADGGAWELVLADINEVCPRSRPNCRALIEANPGRRIDLGNQPLSITISPELTQAVVESRAHGTAPDQIFVVPVASETPTITAAPTVTPAPATSTASPATPEPPTTTEAPTSPEPPASLPPQGSPEPSPANPAGAIEIASGVTVVGEAAYSADGTWLAFSARPSDGSTGPDLYLWRVGDATAIAVTTDHRTYFSAWLGERVLASRVLETAVPTATDEPVAASDDPTNPSEEPSAAPEAPVEEHPISFLLDPATLVQADIAQPDVWLPVVDPTGRFVAYWSGTLLPTADGLDWHLATGELVLDGWSDGEPAAPAEATIDPVSSGEPAAAFGPKGSPVPIVDGDTAAFKSKFDPTGTRLAVWVGEQLDAGIGRLHLIVLDPETGTIDSEPSPLAGVPALRRFSIDTGRVAWVTPSGQDGQESAVQVLGWSKDDFGEIRTIPARDLFIVR